MAAMTMGEAGEQRHVGGVGRMPGLIDEGVETGDAEQGHENDLPHVPRTSGSERSRLRPAKGRMVRNAMLQRQKDSSTGESAPARPRATTKFPLQTTVASRANRYPVTVWEKMGMAGSRGLGGPMVAVSGPEMARRRTLLPGRSSVNRDFVPSLRVHGMRGRPFYPVCAMRNR